MTQVIDGKTNTKLRQFNQTGLLKMISRFNCLDYTCITSTDMESMIGIVNVNTMEAIIQFHLNILSKVYPNTGIVFGAKGDPKPMWLSGAQLVGINHQAASSTSIQTNNAMFASNGSCGYVLKPNVLLTGPETSCVITLKIIEARHLRTLKHINEQLFEPHIRVSPSFTYASKGIIQVTIEEPEQRDTQVWDTEKEPRDRRQNRLMNGFHTVWDAKFEEGGQIKGRVVLNKNVAFLKFVLTEVRLFLENFFKTSFRRTHKT